MTDQNTPPTDENGDTTPKPLHPPIEEMVGDRAPEHGEDFWSTITSGLQGPVVVPITADPQGEPGETTVPEQPTAEPTRANPVVQPEASTSQPGPTRVVPAVPPAAAEPRPQEAAASAHETHAPASLHEARVRRAERSTRVPFVAAIAAVMLALVGTIGYFSLRDGNDTELAEQGDPTPPTNPTAEPEPAVPATAAPTSVPQEVVAAPPSPVRFATSDDSRFDYWTQEIPGSSPCGGTDPGNVLLVSPVGADTKPVPVDGSSPLMADLSYQETTERGTIFLDSCNGQLSRLHVGTDPNDDGTFGTLYTFELGENMRTIGMFTWISDTTLQADVEALIAPDEWTPAIHMDLLSSTWQPVQLTLPAEALPLGSSPDGMFEYFTSPSRELGCEGLENTVDLLVQNTSTGVIVTAAIERFNTVTQMVHNGTHMAWITSCEGLDQVWTSKVIYDDPLLMGAMDRVWRVENPALAEGAKELSFFDFNLHVSGEFFLGTSSYADTFVVNPDNGQLIDTLYTISPALEGAVAESSFVLPREVGTSPDGRFRYVYAVHPDAPKGCEGENMNLYVVGNNGWAIPAAPAGNFHDNVVTNQWVPSDGLTVAFATACEGYDGTVHVATFEPNGTLRLDASFVVADNDTGVGSVTKLEWVDDAFNALNVSVDSFDVGELRFNIDLETGEITEIPI